MRFGIALPNYGPLAAPATLARLAREAEARGADSVWVSDHLVAPIGVASVYPYDRRPDAKPGDMGVIEEFYEPLTTLAYLAGQTTRVRLGVSAYVLPYRNPVVTAKQVATLDALSGGRVVLGIASGWLREEFAALDVPFAGRGGRTEEYLAVCRALWSGEGSFAGRFYTLPPVRTGPRPAQHPHPPLWIAGNSATAIDRAARLGDGLHVIDLSPEELAPVVARLRERLAAHGRSEASVTVSLRKGVLVGSTTAPRPLYGDRDAVRRDLEAYRTVGLDYLVANLRQAKTADDLVRALDEVTSALAG